MEKEGEDCLAQQSIDISPLGDVRHVVVAEEEIADNWHVSMYDVLQNHQLELVGKAVQATMKGWIGAHGDVASGFG